jgi:hypothetical protein
LNASPVWLDTLQQLHEGSIARYWLRRSEYIAWQHAQAQC